MKNKTKKGFTWGHGIIVTFVLFGAFMAYFYIHMTGENIELVGKGYYEDGQKFQEKIDERKQTAALGKQAIFEVSSDYQAIKVDYPVGTEKLSLVFYRPSGSSMDQQINVISPKINPWIVPTPFLVKGPWLVSLRWKQGGKNYRNEQRINVP